MALDYGTLREIVAAERLPRVIVDLDAFDRNLDRHLKVLAQADLPLRVASKSIRVVALLRRVLARPRTRGIMCFAVAEAVALAELGFDDLFVAYPAMREVDITSLADLTKRGVTVSAAIDSEEGLRRFSNVGRRHGVTLRAVFCVDMSLRLARGNVHLGVRRSPLHSVDDVVALAEKLRASPFVKLAGLLGYEAQVAGLGDDSPFDSALSRLGKSLVRKVSMRELGRRRSRIVQALEQRGFELGFVNGGGTGSLVETDRSTGVTEVTAGSGLFKPLLFDGYASDFVRSLEPACFFALEVTRRSSAEFVTCAGGGYVASGALGQDKLPRPYLPEGLALSPLEGAGEVQTPLTGRGIADLALGDPIFFRHAKAGEVMERFGEVLLVENGKLVDRTPTYRGQGFCFL